MEKAGVSHGKRSLEARELIEQRLRSEGLLERGYVFRLARLGMRVLAPLASRLAEWRVAPDLISILSLFFAVGAAALVFSGNPWLAVGLLAASGLCDMLDGWVARLRGIASPAGEVLDALCDRLGEFVVFGAFLLRAAARIPSLASHLETVAAVLALTGAFIMSYSSALISESRVRAGIKAPRGIMRRSERALVTIGSAALIESWSSAAYLLLGVMGMLALVSGVWRLLWFKAALVGVGRAPSEARLGPGESVPPDTWLKRDSRWLAPGIQGLATESALVVERGRGVLLEDLSGRTWVDWVAGMGVASIGHAHPRWAEALAAQAGLSSVGSFTTRARVDFLERLFESHAPANLDCAQLYSGGAEAVESAIRLAREATGRTSIAHFRGAFHGKTRGALSLMGSDWKKPWGPFQELSPLELPYADCTRCPLGLSPAGCEMACAGRVEHLLAQHGGALAAVIVEPVQGTSGNVIPAQGFLKRIEAAARARGILVIADEMITGFGRTGHFWGIEHSGLLPDIVLAGKGMAGGFPMSALLTKRSLSDEAPFWSAPSGSSSSYGANPLACAAASATLGVLDDEDLVRNSAIQGRFFLEKLEELRKKFPEVIEAVRGQGLMLGVDFAEELTPGFQKHLFQEALSEGVLTLAYARRLRIQPPLAINETEIQTSLMRFERALLSTVRWSEKTRKSATSTEIFSSQRAS